MTRWSWAAFTALLVFTMGTSIITPLLPLYVERYGHPRLRARHLPFAIGDAARDQWMLCMERALRETLEDAELATRLTGALAQVADHMRNQAG